MKRSITFAVLVAMAAVLAPVLRADVKTRQHTQFKLEGLLGGLVNTFGGSAAKEGITNTVALKGNRLARLSDLSGQIVDLSEEKVYNLDVKKKEYKVTTFAELKQQFQQAQADAQKRMQNMKPEEKQQAQDAAKQLEIDAEVKETGQHKTIAGHDAHEVVLRLTAHEQGKKIEDSGGFIMTSDMWVGPKVAALDEVAQFELKFIKAVYGESFAADMQQMASMFAMYPSFKPMMEKMQTEGRKMQGTPLETITTFDAVKSPEQMNAASQQQPSSGGGLAGALTRRIAGNRGGQTQPRSTIMTTTSETLSIETTVSDADVAIPAGLKEKK